MKRAVVVEEEAEEAGPGREWQEPGHEPLQLERRDDGLLRLQHGLFKKRPFSNFLYQNLEYMRGGCGVRGARERESPLSSAYTMHPSVQHFARSSAMLALSVVVDEAPVVMAAIHFASLLMLAMLPVKVCHSVATARGV